MKVPERKDDSPEEFAKQQAALAKQVRESLDRAIQEELDAIMDEGKG